VIEERSGERAPPEDSRSRRELLEQEIIANLIEGWERGDPREDGAQTRVTWTEPP
jgi:hypothetical protein